MDHQYVYFGDTVPVTADDKTVTFTSQEWKGKSTDALGFAVTTIVSDGKSVTSSVTHHAQFLETTKTEDGKAAVATNLVGKCIPICIHVVTL